jgi:hypothetical protein
LAETQKECSLLEFRVRQLRAECENLEHNFVREVAR